MVEERTIKSCFFKEDLLLNKIIDDYYNYIVTIIKNMGILNEEDSKEIISDIFFIVWKNRSKLDKSLIFSPYIASITKKVVYKKINIDAKIRIDDNE